MIEELLSASGINRLAAAAAEYGEDDDDEGNDDDGWEDVLDLGLASTRKELMAYGEGSYTRQPDDETQAYLTDFFVRAAEEDLASFGQYYSMLTVEETNKLGKLANPGGA